MHPLLAFGTGILAGLAVAVPLGGIGVLLITEGLADGFRRAAPAALGVATVDLGYATLAVLVGSHTARVLEQASPWPNLAGGIALLVIAGLGLRRLGDPGEPKALVSGSRLRRYLVFVGLTAVNPATVIYFAAIVTGLNAVTGSLPVGTAFVIGVAIASAGWQLGLVGLAATLHIRLGTAGRRTTVVAGNTLVAVMGAAVLAKALWFER